MRRRMSISFSTCASSNIWYRKLTRRNSTLHSGHVPEPVQIKKKPEIISAQYMEHIARLRFTFDEEQLDATFTQCVSAWVHHQFERWISIFGRFAFRTNLIVHCAVDLLWKIFLNDGLACVQEMRLFCCETAARWHMTLSFNIHRSSRWQHFAFSHFTGEFENTKTFDCLLHFWFNFFRFLAEHLILRFFTAVWPFANFLSVAPKIHMKCEKTTLCRVDFLLLCSQ